MIKLLARLVEPTAGAILVDDVQLSEIDPRAWQQRCVAVFQEFIRYPWSAAENIALREDMDQSLLESAARQAGALELVEALPQGWDTRLSRQFSSLDVSGGEWQRHRSSPRSACTQRAQDGRSRSSTSPRRTSMPARRPISTDHFLET